MTGSLGQSGRSISDARIAADAVLQMIKLDHRANILARHLTLPEKKRLELARALATQPKLLLLDEVMAGLTPAEVDRSEEHTSELQSLMRISYAVFCLKKKKKTNINKHTTTNLHTHA